jgi:hypothetical protein
MAALLIHSELVIIVFFNGVIIDFGSTSWKDFVGFGDRVIFIS